MHGHPNMLIPYADARRSYTLTNGNKTPVNKNECLDHQETTNSEDNKPRYRKGVVRRIYGVTREFEIQGIELVQIDTRLITSFLNSWKLRRANT